MWKIIRNVISMISPKLIWFVGTPKMKNAMNADDN